MSLAIIKVAFKLCSIILSHNRTVLIIVKILNAIIIFNGFILSHIFLSIDFEVLLVITFILNIVSIVELIISM
jgi:hypothetical protein